jgi:hypothetical protein
MNLINKYQRNIFFGLLAVMLIVLLFFASGAAVNIDEILHYNYAKQVIDWFATGGQDASCLNTPITNLKYYGQSIDNLSALINRAFSVYEYEYLTRHYIGAVITWLLLIATGLLAREITGSYIIGILAVLLFVISPRPMGQAFGNLKDIPFALGYTVGLLALVRIFKNMPYPRWKDILFLAVAIAFTNSVRIGGLIFYPYLGLFFVVWLYLNRFKTENQKSMVWWGSIVVKGLVVLMIGYFVGILFWPYGLDNPIIHPIESLRVMEHYKVSIRQIFMGEMTWSTNLPWYYLPLWMIISIPEIVWIGIVGYIVFLAIGKNRQSFSLGILQFSFLFPIIYVLIVDANLYSGWRQMYFIYPSMVILSAIGLNSVYRWINNNWGRITVGIVAVLLALMPVVHTVKTFPADYVYFNQFAGGTKKAWSEYEYDYYWHGMREAADWLMHNEKLREGIVIASNLKMGFYFPDNNGPRVEYVHFYDRNAIEWDYAILGNNYVHPYQLKQDTWKPENSIKTFYHKDNPYIVILKNQNRDAVEGISLYKQKKTDEAIPLLKSAIESDSTDVRVIATLGACYLKEKDWEKLELLLSDGFKIYPEYESLLHLEAQMEFDKKNYKKSKNICIKLLKLNPKYIKIVDLLSNCFDELGEHDLANEYRRRISNN